MRISDWSSDVCSSDLQRPRRGIQGAAGEARLAASPDRHAAGSDGAALRVAEGAHAEPDGHPVRLPATGARAAGRTARTGDGRLRALDAGLNGRNAACIAI